MTTARALHLLRVPVLLGLLFAVGASQVPLADAVRRIQLAESRLQWLLLIALAAAFVAVALVGRSRRHSWDVLVVEGIIAAILGITPPVQWVMWFGPSTVTDLVGASTGFAVVPALAITWLVTVVITSVRQARGANSPAVVAGDAPPPGGSA